MKAPKIDYRYFFRYGMLNSSASIIEAITGFIFQTIILVYLSTTEYAKYQWYLVFFGYFMLLTVPTLRQYAQHLFYRYKIKAWYTLYKFKIILQTIGSLAVFTISFFIPQFQTEMQLAAILVLLGNFSLYNDFFQVTEQFKEITMNRILRYSFYFGLAIIMTVKYKNGLVTAFTVLVAEQMFHIIYSFYVNLKNNVQKQRIKLDYSQILFLQGQQLVQLLHKIEILLIPLFFPLQTLAMYSASQIIPSAMNNLIKNTVMITITKKVLQNDMNQLFQKFRTNIVWIMFVSGLSVIIISLISISYLYLTKSNLINLAIIILFGILSLTNFFSNVLHKILNLNLKSKKSLIIKSKLTIVQVTLVIIFLILQNIYMLVTSKIVITIIELYFITRGKNDQS